MATVAPSPTSPTSSPSPTTPPPHFISPSTSPGEDVTATPTATSTPTPPSKSNNPTSPLPPSSAQPTTLHIKQESQLASNSIPTCNITEPASTQCVASDSTPTTTTTTTTTTTSQQATSLTATLSCPAKTSSNSHSNNSKNKKTMKTSQVAPTTSVLTNNNTTNTTKKNPQPSVTNITSAATPVLMASKAAIATMKQASTPQTQTRTPIKPKSQSLLVPHQSQQRLTKTTATVTTAIHPSPPQQQQQQQPSPSTPGTTTSSTPIIPQTFVAVPITSPRKPRAKGGRKAANPHLTEEQRRQERVLKNRESAMKSLQKKKRYTQNLEHRAMALAKRNMELRDKIRVLLTRLNQFSNTSDPSQQQQQQQRFVTTPSVTVTPTPTPNATPIATPTRAPRQQRQHQQFNVNSLTQHNNLSVHAHAFSSIPLPPPPTPPPPPPPSSTQETGTTSATTAITITPSEQPHPQHTPTSTTRQHPQQPLPRSSPLQQPSFQIGPAHQQHNSNTPVPVSAAPILTSSGVLCPSNGANPNATAIAAAAAAAMSYKLEPALVDDPASLHGQITTTPQLTHVVPTILCNNSINESNDGKTDSNTSSSILPADCTEWRSGITTQEQQQGLSVLPSTQQQTQQQKAPSTNESLQQQSVCMPESPCPTVNSPI